MLMNVLRFASSPVITIEESAYMNVPVWWDRFIWHNIYWRYYYNFEDGMTLHTKDGDIVIPANTICIVPPDVRFSGDIKNQLSQFYIHFHIQGTYCPQLKQCLLLEPSEFAISTIEKLSEQFKNNQKDEFSSIFLIQQLILEFLSNIDHKKFNTLAENPRIDKINSFIDDNLDKQTNNNQLAKLLHMEVTSFVRYFKNVSGIPPQKYIMERRINKACNFLQNSNLSIDEIALKTGFCDRYHFTKVFKKMRNLNPGEFRKFQKYSDN